MGRTPSAGAHHQSHHQGSSHTSWHPINKNKYFENKSSSAIINRLKRKIPVCSTSLSPKPKVKGSGAHELKSCCCSHFGQWTQLHREHWIWQSCSFFPWAETASDPGNIYAHLVASHTVLFHLLKFALQLRLSFHLLLSTPDVDGLPVQVLSVHFIHCLKLEICGKNDIKKLN